MNKAKLNVLHENHKDWKHELDFYFDQIERFECLLSEISSKNTIRQVRPQIEQFHHKFVTQKNIIGRLEYEIKIQQQELDEATNQARSPVFETYFKKQEMMYDLINNFQKNHEDLKKSFRDFTEEWT